MTVKGLITTLLKPYRDEGDDRLSISGDDARIELTLPAAPGPYPVTDMVFSNRGAMILAQRAPLAASLQSALTTAA